MAITQITGTIVRSTNGNTVTTPTIDTTGAKLLVVSMSYYTANASVFPALTDSAGNQWLPLTAYGSAGYTFNVLYVCMSPTTSATHSFTATCTANYPVLGVQAFTASGFIALAMALGAFTISSVTSFQPGSITSPANGMLFVSGLSQGAGSGFSINNSFTALTQNYTTAQNVAGGIGYLIQATAGSLNPTWSWTTAGNAASTMALFKEVSTSGAGGRRANRMAMEIKQGTSTTPLRFLMVSSTDGSTPVTGLGSTPVVTLCKANGSSFSPAAGAVSELGGGKYQVAGNTTDTNTLGVLSLHATGAGAAAYDEDFLIVGYDPLSSTNLGLSALPTVSPSVTGGLLTAANNSNCAQGVVDNVIAAINGWTTVDVGVALANSRILNCTGILSPTITNQRFSPWYMSAIFNSQLVFYNFSSWFIWWDSTNLLWTMSTAIGARGTNYWTSPKLVGTWTAGGSAAGSPVFASLGISTDPNLPNARYDSNGNVYSNLQVVLGNAVTVDSNNLLNVNAKDLGGQLAQLDANGLLKVDLEDIKGTSSQGVAGYVGPDWSHVNSPGTTVSLSATTISSSQQVASVSGSVGSVTGSVGSIDGLSIPTAVEIRQEIDNNSTKLGQVATATQLNSAVTDIESAIADQASNISINIPPAVAIASQDPSTIAILRGDTLRVSLPPAGSIASRTKLTITAKQDLNDSDAQAIFQVVEGIGLVRSNGLSPTSSSDASLTVVDQSSGTITLVIEPTVTSTFAIQDLVWDLQVESPGGILSPLSGIATVFADVTRAVT